MVIISLLVVAVVIVVVVKCFAGNVGYVVLCYVLTLSHIGIRINIPNKGR